MSGARHARQRENRRRLKADAVILLDRIVAFAHDPNAPPLPDLMMAEIAEMRLRFAPAPGVASPIVRTGYTKHRHPTVVPVPVPVSDDVGTPKKCPACGIPDWNLCDCVPF